METLWACFSDLETLWMCLSDQENQRTVTFVGTGIAVAVCGLWAFIKFRLSRSSGSSAPSISADHGGIAAGRDVKITGRYKRPKH